MGEWRPGTNENIPGKYAAYRVNGNRVSTITNPVNENKKRTPDFGAISRSSIKRDFQRVQRYPKEEKRPEIEELPKINAERRIIHISETSAYAKFARFIVGKLIRIREKANVGG